MNRRLVSWVVVGFVLGLSLLPGSARADAIMGPPERCPPGAVPASSHAGSYCDPSICTSNGDCESGHVCTKQPLCVEPMTGYHGGGPLTVDNALTTCAGDGTCPPSTTCITEMRCVSRASSSGGDGVAIPSAGIAVAIAVVLLLILVLLCALAVVVVLLRKKQRRERRD